MLLKLIPTYRGVGTGEAGDCNGHNGNNFCEILGMVRTIESLSFLFRKITHNNYNVIRKLNSSQLPI